MNPLQPDQVCPRPCPSWALMEQSQKGSLKPLLHQHLPLMHVVLELGQLPSHPPSSATIQLVKQRWEQHRWMVAMPPQHCGMLEPPSLCLVHHPATVSMVQLWAQHPQKLVSPLDLHQPHHSGMDPNVRWL